MDNFGKDYCRLCLSAISNENFEKISSVTRKDLDILLLKLNVDKNIICKVCSLNVREALKFKSTCLHTDDIIVTYVENVTGSSLDLLEVYAKEKKDKQLVDTLHDRKVCRLCLQLIQDKFMFLNEVETDVIEKYIPEMKINLVEDPVVCIQCFDSLATHSSFITNCLKEEKIINCYGGSGSHSPSRRSASELCIKDEESIIKQEVDEDQDECKENKFTIEPIKEDNEYEIKTEYINIKSEEDNESESILRNSPTLPTLTHEEHEHSLNDHILTDSRNLSEPEEAINKCLYCHNEIKCKRNMKRHIVSIHGNMLLDPQENLKIQRFLNINENLTLKTYKCDMCDYETTHKFSLKSHQLTHKNPSEVEMYKCDKCSYESRYRNSLERHLLKHKDSSQVQIYKCVKCSYESRYKDTLRKHQLRHKDPSQVQMYRCDKCVFASRYKSCLKQHQLKHKDPSQVQMYNCDKCNFKTMYKKNFKYHQLKQKSKCASVTNAFL